MSNTRTTNTRPTTEMVLATEEAKRNPLAALDMAMQKAAPRLAEIVPRGIDPVRVMQLAMSNARRDPKLLACTTSSVLIATAQIAALGLEPGTALQQAYLVPRKNRKKVRDEQTGREDWKDVHEATAIIGYRGFALIAHDGERIDARASVVYEGDTFTFFDGFEPVLRHAPADSYPEDGPRLRGTFCMWRFPDGRRDAIYWPRVLLERHRDRFAPRKYNSTAIVGPWADHFEAMCQKTMIRMAAKMWPLSSERMRHALRVDDAGESGRFDPLALAPADERRAAESTKALRAAVGEPDVFDAPEEDESPEPAREPGEEG